MLVSFMFRSLYPAFFILSSDEFKLHNVGVLELLVASWSDTVWADILTEGQITFSQAMLL